jgi:hypothetical protein
MRYPKTFMGCGHLKTEANMLRETRKGHPTTYRCRVCTKRNQARRELEQKSGSVAALYAEWEELSVLYLRLQGYAA